MKQLWIIYKDEMVFSLLIGGLFLWGVVATTFAIKNREKVILIGKTKNSYQLIDKKEKDPLEIENFIRHFLGLTLNFDEESYKRHISLSGDLMTEALWKRKKPELKEMMSFIKEYKVIQSSELLEIRKIKSNHYEVKIRNYLFKKGVLKEKDKFILLSLTDNKRSYANPWRYSVKSVEVIKGHFSFALFLWTRKQGRKCAIYHCIGRKARYFVLIPRKGEPSKSSLPCHKGPHRFSK